MSLVTLDRMSRQERTALFNTIDRPSRFCRSILGDDLWPGQEEILDALATPRVRLAVKACHSSGKALALDTPIATPDGWTTMGELTIGDTVFDQDGQPARVVQVSPVMTRPSYRVTFSTGESLIASDDHLWSVIDLRHRPRTWPEGNAARHHTTQVLDWRDHWDAARDVTTEHMAQHLRAGSQYRWRVPLARPLAGGLWPLTVDPYTFGAWLGDGARVRAELTCSAEDVPHWLATVGGTAHYPPDRAPRVQFGVRAYLDAPSRETDGEKHIPVSVLRASVEDRFAVLQGIMDTDGWATPGTPSVSVQFMNQRLADDTRALAVSLGYKVHTRERRATLRGRDCGAAYVVSFVPGRCPFRMERKASLWVGASGKQSRVTSRTVVSIEPVGIRGVRCIGVDSPRHLYLAGDGMIPTHNTFTASRGVQWFVTRYPAGQVVTTAPTWTQVKRLLWREIKQSIDKRFTDIDLLTTELRTPEGSNAFGLSTNEGVRFQGYHGQILIVVDEALGVAPDIFEAIEGIRASGDVRVLLIGNPTAIGGKFYDAFQPGSGWRTMTISAFDTPNLAGLSVDDIATMDDDALDANRRPELVTRRWVREALDEYGVDDPYWHGRVIAEFPELSTHAAFPAKWVTAAALAGPKPDECDIWVAGCDAAGPGEDETTLVLRHGQKVIRQWAFDAADPRGEIAAALGPYKDRLKTLHIDANGLGYGYALHLRDLGYPVNMINAGSASSHPHTDESGPGYENFKAEMYWSFRGLLQAGEVHNIRDDQTQRQMKAIRYENKANGKLSIESKPAYRKRVGGSPDRAEAVIMAFLPPVSTAPLVGWEPDSMEKESIWR